MSLVAEIYGDGVLRIATCRRLVWTSQASTGTARSSCDSGNSCNEGLARVRSAITLIKRIRYQLFTVTNCWIAS